MQHEVVVFSFENLWDLKINFHKSELICLGEAQGTKTQYTELFGCKSGDLPLKYLGILVH